jgi:hypothetical protein
MIVALEANDFDRSLEAAVALVVVDRFWASFVESIFLEKQKQDLIRLPTFPYVYRNIVLFYVIETKFKSVGELKYCLIIE